MAQLTELIAKMANGSLTTRRAFMKRSILMGAAIPMAGSLLAACGGDEEDEDAPTATARAGVPTPLGVGGNEPTDEPADAEATEEQGDDEATEEPADSEATSEATEEPAGDETPDASAGEGQQGGVLVLMGHEAVDGLSPDYTGPTVNWSMITQIHNGLTEMDPWYEYQPVLAESWEVTDDGLEYTFALRDDVVFHDGEAFTSEDVVYTFEFYGNPDNATLSASDFDSIESVEAPDESTVVVTLLQPNAAFITKAGSAFIVPEHHHGSVGEEQYAREPIGTGAFMLSEYVPAEFVEVVAFEDHFRGRPNLDGVRLNVVPEPSVRAIALETGDADSSVWSLQTEDNIRLRDSGDFQTYISSSTAVNNFPMDNTSPQLSEKVVRQALMYAIDRDAIVNDLWQGLAVKATTNLSPALSFFHDDSGVKMYEYDPEMARQMLDDAGWVVGADGIREKEGVRLSWTCGIIAGDQARRPIAESLQQWVSEIGCEMEIIESTAMSEEIRDHNIQMGLHNWTYGGSGGDPDASSTLHSKYSGSRVHYSNPEMDDLLDQGLAETDPAARQEIYKRIQEIFCEDVPILYLQYWDWFVFFSQRVKGLPEDEVLSGSTLYNMANTFWVEEA